MVKEKIQTIHLLNPNGSGRGIIESNHDSKWSKIKERNVDRLLSSSQQSILNSLVKNDQWIIEESNNLIEMVRETDQNLNS